jgi:flagellin-like protein
MRHKSKRGIRNRRAISTVVASILVLAITVALAVGLLTFGSSFMTSQEKMQPPTTDQIKIENVDFINANAANITVRNIGAASVTLSSIYVNGATVTFSGSVSIAVGTVQTYKITSYTFAPGSTYTFMAATSNGGENTYTATW